MPVNVYVFKPHPALMVLFLCHFVEMEIEAPNVIEFIQGQTKKMVEPGGETGL